MRYQERIYNQNGQFMRNKDSFNVNLSTDIFVYAAPTFNVSGATKIIVSEDVCDFSGVTFTDALTGATQCLYDNQLSGGCFDSIVWSTSIVEDGTEVYNTPFLTTTGETEEPTQDQFIDSVTLAFDTLGYDYAVSGTQFTIQKPYGVTDLYVNVNTLLNLDENCQATGTTYCGCPVGYSANPENSACVYYDTSAATLNGVLYTAYTGSLSTAYNDSGTFFYRNLDDTMYPMYMSGNSNVVYYSGGTPVPISAFVNTGTLWVSAGSTANGRLNNVGVWPDASGAPTNEWIGFSYCLDIPTTGTYCVGISADNRTRFRLNGETIFTSEDLINGSNRDLIYWKVFELQITAGLNIIEMEARNDGAAGTMGAEIYNVGIDILSGYTAETQLSAVTIFSTEDLRYETNGNVPYIFQLGESSGYSCSEGYAMNTCGTGTPVCTLIQQEFVNCDFSGSCDDYDYTACYSVYDTLSASSTGVYIVDEETEIDLLFQFTGYTSSFTDDTQFRFEIYKFDHDDEEFVKPSVYASGLYDYADFSGTSSFETAIPISSLDIDGDYLLKGFFIDELPTHILSRLGLTFDSSEFNVGSHYKLYSPFEDYYFVVMRVADTPTIVETTTATTRPLGSLIAYSQLPSDGDTLFPVTINVVGDLLVYLNGMMLADNYDYTFDGTNVELSGATLSGDVLTFVAVTDEDFNGLVVDNINIDYAIVSGATDGQGSEDVYYNTTQGKYELFTSVTPVDGNDIIVTLNGVTLANNIDYYQSISNPKRIILEGNLLVGDVLNIIYNGYATYVGNIYTSNPTIAWTIDPPQLANGYFVVEVASDEDFTTIVSTATTEYVAQSSYYLATVSISGLVGTTLYYRVHNYKNYESLNGDTISSESFSEVIPIVIMTNNINSY